MRFPAVLLLFACAAPAQFRTTAPLVVAPTTVKDAKGRYVDGLVVEDLVLYDNNVPQKIQLEWLTYPIDLVVAVQTAENAGAVIDKLGGSGVLFAELLAADGGETAVLSFSHEVKLHLPFTGNAELVTHALRMLRKEGGGPCTLDALKEAFSMLERRPAGRRRIVLVVAEKRERGSEANLADVAAQAQRLNVAVYWLTFSPFLQPYTVKPKTMEDLKPEAERIKAQKCAWCEKPDDRPAPPDLGPGGFIYALGELARMSKPDLSALFPRVTGGRTSGFLTKGALEKTIQLVGEEIHRQYILTFEPKGGEPGTFHAIRVAVKDRPELQARTREGYWVLP
jgi:VWFA-related protein